MKCRCGYEGDPEYGEFQDLNFPTLKVHMRCPMCFSTWKFMVEVHERIKMCILYPEYCYGSVDYGKHEPVKNVVLIFKGKGDLDAYSIFCPLCGWGEGGGLDKQQSKELVALGAKVEVVG